MTQTAPAKTLEEAARDVLAHPTENPAPPTVEDLTDDDDEAPPKPAAEAGAIPAWAQIPVGLHMPDGWQIHFMRFRPEWTNVPRLGARTCILWNLTESDEKLAAKRARGDANRIIDEMSKQMIRAIDGAKVDWTKGNLSNVEKFWDEIGGKCRHLVRSYYLKTHTLKLEEQVDFFDSCVAVRTHTG